MLKKEDLTKEDIERNEAYKKEICNKIKNSLKDGLTEERLEKFEKDFYSITKNIYFERNHDRKKEK